VVHGSVRGQWRKANEQGGGMSKKGGEVTDIRLRVQQLIYEAIDDLQEAGKERIEKTPETVLLGRSSAFDSLKLVNLIVAVEQRVEEEFGFAISAIANEKAMSEKSSPLRSVSTLAEFIAGIISEQRHG